MFNFIFNKDLSSTNIEFKDNINLLDIFNISYRNFLNFKLNNILNYIFPIYIYKSNYLIDFKSYNFIYPNKSTYFCLNKGLTYSLSLKIFFNIYSYDIDYKTANLVKYKIKEDFIYIPDIPLITKNCTFIIDGVEKSLVSKFVRSPGIYFIIESKAKHVNHILKLVPDIGPEIDFILDFDNILYLKFKKKKLFLTDVLKCFGLNNRDIINNFYNFISIIIEYKIFKIKFYEDYFLNYSFPFDIFNNNNELIVKKNTVISSNDIKNIKDNEIEYILIDENFLLGKHIFEDLYFGNLKFAKSLQIIDSNLLKNIIDYNLKSFNILVYGSSAHYSIIKTMSYTKSFFESLNKLNDFLNHINFNIFNFDFLNFNSNFNKKEFFISLICRKKMNFYFKKNCNSNNLNLTDVINIIKSLVAFKDGLIQPTDSLNIGNLNIYMIGENLYDIFLNFFLELKKNIKDSFINFLKYKVNVFFKVFNLVNKIKKFFSVSKYCQYLDQVNALSELSHKRRVSFLGVIGISKKYSGFEQRDLNISHYSKLCPIETPEGINIGLVGSLALLCKVDKYNFLVSPYYKVLNGKILKRYFYLGVDEEFNSFISDSKLIFKTFNNIDNILVKFGDQLITTNKNLINYVNVLPYQILSASTTLIPFLENNDSNRALMASNMLRQALPLIYPEPPLISTGFEKLIFNNSSNNLKCFNNGILNYLDSRFIIIKSFFNFKDFYFYNYDLYFFIKYMSSNQKTIISQRFDSFSNKKFYNNDILSNDSCFSKNILSLGKNVLTAFMSWEGYNFEDSIIVSDKVVFNDKYTSLEIIQIDVNVFMVNKDSEILTKKVIMDNFGFNNLNSFGLIKLGKMVFGGDIIVGKVRQIFDDFDEVDPNHRLLYSIFLNQSEFDKHDTSFYLPEKFNSGTVTSLNVYFSDSSNLSILDKKLLNFQIKKILNNKNFRYFFLKKKIKKMLINFLIGKEIYYNNINMKINYNFLKKRDINFILNLNLLNKYYFYFDKIKKKVKFFLKIYKFFKKNLKKNFFKDMSLSLSKIIKIVIISKKQLQVGDKMSGRYGNKGVVSKILPSRYMPHMFNGEPIEIILNPLGVPSRMNVGQLLEIHLGFASLCLTWKLFDLLNKNNSFNKIKDLLIKIYNKDFEIETIKSLNYIEILNLLNFFKNGFYFSVKPFSDFTENNINRILNLIFSDNFLFDFGVSENNKQVFLYDGRNGKKYENKTTVGLMYLFKLNHLSEDKIHSRSVGPYSMITQQPLKGKSNKGGQRLGEMEAWAIEAYGAFYSLQEMFTIKSDDVSGRFKAYKSIVKNVFDFTYDIPETFNVMMKNINCLSLYIRFDVK